MHCRTKCCNPFHLHGMLFILLIHLFGLNSFAQKVDSISDFREIPNLKWTFNTKEPIYSSPVVMDGAIFVGGNDSVLHVLDLSSGNEKWRFRTMGQIRSNVCLDSDRVYLSNG